MARNVMLTTIDNPYNPFDDFDKWYTYDVSKGYDSCGLLARLSQTSAELPEEKQCKDIEAGIDRFLAIDPVGVYQKAIRE